MGRIATIENTAASGLPQYNNLKVIVRGRPRFIDPQLNGGTLRFAITRGFNFTSLIPDNQAPITEDAYIGSTRIKVGTLPTAMTIGTLVRIGNSEALGEYGIVIDTIDGNAIDVATPLISNYSASPDQDVIPVLSLVGTPCNVLSPPDPRIITIDSWHNIVPYDILLISSTPTILTSLQEYTIKRANLFGTRAGNSGIGEPAVIYKYQIELDTKTGLLPFAPAIGSVFYLKALPLYFRGSWGTGDIAIPSDVGPCVFDAFYGSLLDTYPTYTKLGIQTWDSFGGQVNASLTGNQQWQAIPSNYLVLERQISSNSLLFWQQITGYFQYQRRGYFQAQLNSEGKFSFSTGLLVPKWPSNREYGWVIPLYSISAVRAIVQFEPQTAQIFEIPANTLTYIRPHVLVDPNAVPIDRLIISFKGSPNSTVQIQDLEYDGTSISSLSYYILGSGAAFGQSRWLAGGFSIKPLFYNLNSLQARYSDGVSHYNAGYLYN
jgi:hypothetical protein